MAGYIERITGTIPHTNKTVDIPLEGKNLIITGGNGSGKTSLLRGFYILVLDLFFKINSFDSLDELKRYLKEKEYEVNKKGYTTDDFEYKQMVEIKTFIECIENNLIVFAPQIDKLEAKNDKPQGIFLYFEDRRLANIDEAKSLLETRDEIYNIPDVVYRKNHGRYLEQHLLNLKTRRSFAITEDNNHELAEQIDKWLLEFEDNLKILFEDKTTHLQIDSNKNKIYIVQDGKPPFTFQTLSSGYNAILNIYANLVMRTEYYSISPTDLEGVVFIDEIDSHLHISLQRLILPFFIESFPKVQFIVTTHSPFVLTSTQDALIYDLGKEEPYRISQLKSQSEILSEYLGVPTAMPVWAEQKLTEILKEYLNDEPDKISLSALKDELINAGLEIYFPDSVTKILETKQ